MSLPVESYDDILRNAGFTITLTTDNVLEIRIKMYNTFVIAYSFNGSKETILQKIDLTL